MEKYPIQFLVTQEGLIEVHKKLDRVLARLDENQVEGKINSKFVSEKEAMKLFKKSSTWFWIKRRDGVIKYHKVGKTIYYKHDELLLLFNPKK